MNTRNVEALEKALVEAFLTMHVGTGQTVHPRSMAEALANNGCLGPASDVLTENDGLSVDAMLGQTNEVPLVTPLAAELERIAKGEA